MEGSHQLKLIEGMKENMCEIVPSIRCRWPLFTTHETDDNLDCWEKTGGRGTGQNRTVSTTHMPARCRPETSSPMKQVSERESMPSQCHSTIAKSQPNPEGGEEKWARRPPLNLFLTCTVSAFYLSYVQYMIMCSRRTTEIIYNRTIDREKSRGSIHF